MNTSVIGYPRIGRVRELKFAAEKYFKGECTALELQQTAKALRRAHWSMQRENGIEFIPSNDFSMYDAMLDMAVLLNAVPHRYRELPADSLGRYFAMARGYQGVKGDVRALAMKKWFNTNYHYIVPEIDDDTDISLSGTKPFDEYVEAKSIGINTKPVLTGAFTFLKLARFTGSKTAADFAPAVAEAYGIILGKLAALGAQWVQFDEPFLASDLSADDRKLFTQLYDVILGSKKTAKTLVQTYFGDVRDCWDELCGSAFDGIGLDFIEGRESLELVTARGFPKEKTLFAGVINGRNIWRTDYAETLALISKLRASCSNVVLSTSCSLLHVPYTVKQEPNLPESAGACLAFAEEKLRELSELQMLADSADPEAAAEYKANSAVFSGMRKADDGERVNRAVRSHLASLSDQDFTRPPAFAERRKIQKQSLTLPLFPTTTIGSFPQTAEIRAKRAAYRKGLISTEEYENFIKEEIARCVAFQESVGLDVIVHGEFERTDMVEYFGGLLEGFIFTANGWVQSYGTRCVKPPIIWGDVSRPHAMTVKWTQYAQSLTKKPVKGMLTGPVTILNWSFPREDIPLKDIALQIALAIRAEVLDLEASGIRIIQIDEAALREKLPLRRSEWKSAYLDWAIPAFRLTHSGVRAETQIHTHMCYSEFADIIREIDDMDADVITFEASRSDLSLLDTLQECNFRTDVGPGVYDIHSPRVPSVGEIRTALSRMKEKIPAEKLWVNPDCGLKTRGKEETARSLINLVKAAQCVRAETAVQL